MLFDYQVHQYWFDNYYQIDFALNPCNKKMFGKDSNMYLIVNAHDDWQVRFSNKLKHIVNQFLKDNSNGPKQWYKNEITNLFRCFQDIKELISETIVIQMKSSTHKESIL